MTQRVLFAFDGISWAIRRVSHVHLSRDGELRTYDTDGSLGGPFPSLEAAFDHWTSSKLAAAPFGQTAPKARKGKQRRSAK